MKKTIEVFTDWSCINNPWPWWWAAVIKDKDNFQIIKWFDEFTTNNRMELLSIIKALEFIERKYILDKHFSINFYTDSKYVKNWITEWLDKWIKNWRKAFNKKPIKNKDLWNKFINLRDNIKNINFYWIKGHNWNYYNELADKIAKSCAKKAKTKLF